MIKGVICFCFILFLSMSASIAQTVRVFFTPSLECENNIIHYIDSAKESIDAAVYAINNDEIVIALLRAYMRGVKVRILTDRTQAGQKSSKVSVLEAFGVPLRRHKRYRIQHDKFAVFDGKKAFTGSYNWTNTASQKNAENCVFFTRKNKTVERYQERFDILWKLNEDRKRRKGDVK